MTAGAVNQQHIPPPSHHHPQHLQVLSQQSNCSSRNRNYHSPTISPLRHPHPSYIPLRHHHRSYFTQGNSPMVLNDGAMVSGSNTSGGKSNNFGIPIIYHPQHHFAPHRNSGIMNSPIGKAYVAFITNILFISTYFFSS